MGKSIAISRTGQKAMKIKVKGKDIVVRCFSSTSSSACASLFVGRNTALSKLKGTAGNHDGTFGDGRVAVTNLTREGKSLIVTAHSLRGREQTRPVPPSLREPLLDARRCPPQSRCHHGPVRSSCLCC